jgi:FkbM family methyltransferase
MKEVDGWHVPDILGAPGKYARRAREDAPRAIDLCPCRRVALQAGGHVGTWPAFLSQFFDTVYTFEPVAENFQCLVRNMAVHRGAGEIIAAQGALTSTRGPVHMLVHGKCSGQHKARYPTDEGIRETLGFRIDDLNLPVVDAIFLDLEGFENFALRGAAETLRRCKPVVMAENNRRSQDHGFGEGDLEIYMRGEGYKLADSVGEDLIFRPRGKT